MRWEYNLKKLVLTTSRKECYVLLKSRNVANPFVSSISLRLDLNSDRVSDTACTARTHCTNSIHQWLNTCEHIEMHSALVPPTTHYSGNLHRKIQMQDY